MILLFSLLACTGKDVAVGDSGDTAVTEDAFPCDADYFPVGFSARRFVYTEYKGRFQQVTGEGFRSLEFLSLYEPGAGTDSTESTESTDSDGMTGCIFNQVIPTGYAADYTVYGVDDEWVYVMADGENLSGTDTFYAFEDPIPLIPLNPVEGWQDVIDSEYIRTDFDTNQNVTVYANLVSLSETITVPGGTYDALKMTWGWEIRNGQDRVQLSLDITGWFDKDEGLVKQSWYDAVEDESGLIEFEGY